ncbi:translation initiation factor IF-2-like [Aquila chrysaetos chrysaetos]|uniref:translation initiation factor IF-2-like n=1 Tax=Aquila chrysaetos chrysaetos TaxID=223781 RepID=UPI001B7D3D23|nr:translation initiation factor IF-2-like [Aquila chrysaetos chrysaetos]
MPLHVHTHTHNPARTPALLQAGEQAAVEAHARPGGGGAARGRRCCGQGERPPPPSRPSARSPPNPATAKARHRSVRPVRRAPWQPAQGLSSLIWAGCQGWPAGGSGGRGMAGDLWRGARAGAVCGRCCRRRPRHARTGGVRPGHPSRVGPLGRRGRRGRGEQGLGGRLVARHRGGLAIAARSGGQVGRGPLRCKFRSPKARCYSNPNPCGGQDWLAGMGGSGSSEAWA